jgi:hypothetical protein
MQREKGTFNYVVCVKIDYVTKIRAQTTKMVFGE